MTELGDLAQQVAGWAAPGEHVEAFLASGRTLSIRAHRGELERFVSADPSGAGIRVVVDGRQGFASCGTLDETVLKETLEDARDNVAFATRDEFVGLAEPDGVAALPIDGWNTTLLDVPTAAKRDLVLDLERRGAAAGPGISAYSANYGDTAAEQAIATSTGIFAYDRATFATLNLTLVAERDGDKQIAGGSGAADTFSGLDPDEVLAEAIERSTRLLGATKPRSSRLTVVLDRDVTTAFLALIGSTLSGEAVLKGRSLFANRIGQQVAHARVSLVEDPIDTSRLGASAYDDEGLAHRRVSLIEDGVLQRYLYDTAAARRAGCQSTASARRGYASTPSIMASALTLGGGRGTQSDVLAEVGDGLFVQSVSGLHSGVNPVSGDFSVGATGLMIRNGALAEPVREVTIASTLQRMLLDVTAIGDDARNFPGHAGVSLGVAEVMMSGA